VHLRWDRILCGSLDEYRVEVSSTDLLPMRRMNPERLHAISATVGMDYGHFVIESRGLTEPPRFAFADSETLIPPADGAPALRVESSFTRFAHVRLEAWSGEPSGEVPAGAAHDEATVQLSDPGVYVRGAMSPAAESEVLVAGSAGTYGCRVHRWGAERVAAAFEADPDDVDGRVEEFLVRLWPVSAEAGSPGADRVRSPEEDRFEAIARWAREQG